MLLRRQTPRTIVQEIHDTLDVLESNVIKTEDNVVAFTPTVILQQTSDQPRVLAEDCLVVGELTATDNESNLRR